MEILTRKKKQSTFFYKYLHMRFSEVVQLVSESESEKDLDDLVRFFEKRDIPLAINHCVSLYPSEDDELELDQIDYLKNSKKKILNLIMMNF